MRFREHLQNWYARITAKPPENKEHETKIEHSQEYMSLMFPDQVEQVKTQKETPKQSHPEKQHHTEEDYLSKYVQKAKLGASEVRAYISKLLSKKEVRTKLDEPNLESTISDAEIEAVFEKKYIEHPQKTYGLCDEDIASILDSLKDLSYIRKKVDELEMKQTEVSETKQQDIERSETSIEDLKLYLDKLAKGIRLVAERIVKDSNKEVSVKKDPALDEIVANTSKIARGLAQLARSQRELQSGLEEIAYAAKNKSQASPEEIEPAPEQKVIIDQEGNVSFDQARLEKLFAIESVNTRRLILNKLDEIHRDCVVDPKLISRIVHTAVVTSGYGSREAKLIGGKKTPTKIIDKDLVQDIDYEQESQAQMLNSLVEIAQLSADFKSLKRRSLEEEESRIDMQKALAEISSKLQTVDAAFAQRNDNLMSNMKSSVGDISAQVSEELEKQQIKSEKEKAAAFKEIVKTVVSHTQEVSGDLDNMKKQLSGLTQELGQVTGGMQADLQEVLEESRAAKQRRSSGRALGLGGGTIRITKPVKKGKSEIWALDEEERHAVAVKCITAHPELIRGKKTVEAFTEELKATDNLEQFIAYLEMNEKKILKDMLE
jgi:hypothetical protein